MKQTFCITLLALSVGACGGDDDGGADAGPADAAPITTASVQIQPSTGQTITGTGQFVRIPGGAAFSMTLSEAPPGVHGTHIHAIGDCGMDGMNAGDHWNPEEADHGMPGADPSHYGDMGNMAVAADGTGSLSISRPDWTIGDGSTTDVIGKAVIVHEVDDDFGQPLGNAGARIGCGVITSP